MSPQQSIAHYRIVSKLGEGGMGAVYRATDTKLNRDVAIKVLPEAFRDDSARMTRFEREAHVRASLNHPNIAAIYGIEQGAIVMELVPGEELKGPVPVDAAIGYAKQLAAALEAAHEKGIVHRDLKPANIKITPEGTLKVLDFGLAKATDESPVSATGSPTMSPTLSLEMTQAGVILGTAAYMSPEQARGKPVDKRADIWSFRVVLFEMLSGMMIFGGETMSDSLAAVLAEEPDWSTLPKATPPHVRRLLERCLRKDPHQRLRDIGEARIALDEPESAAPADATRPARRWMPWAIAGLAAIAVAAGLAAGLILLRPKPPARQAIRFPLEIPEGYDETVVPATPEFAPSPDGSQIAMVLRKKNGTNSIWVRPIGALAVHQLDGTEDADLPFWSPDGKFIGYFAQDQLKIAPAAGGPSRTLCTLPGKGQTPSSPSSNGDGGTWNTDGEIVFANRMDGPLLRIAAGGGAPVPAFPVQADPDTRFASPQFMPDGRHVLYLERRRNTAQNAIYVQELGSAARVLVLKNSLRAAWAPPGWLLFAHDAALYAQRMDPATFRLGGSALTVSESVLTSESGGRAAFEVGGGVLMYRPGNQSAASTLAWYSRDGKREGTIGAKLDYHGVRLSPDGHMAQLLIYSGRQPDIWVMDLGSGALTRMTAHGDVSDPLGKWSPDGARIAVNRYSPGALEVTVSSLQSRPVLDAGAPQDYSPDGSFLLAANRFTYTLTAWPVANPHPQTIHVFDAPVISFRFSPEGKYVAYISGESGASQVMVASYPSFSEKRQVSLSGGNSPIWRKDGKELFFLDPNRTVMSVEISTRGKIEAATPKPLFRLPDSPPTTTAFWPAPDGHRFLVIEQDRATGTPVRTVVVNWTADLRQGGTEQ